MPLAGKAGHPPMIKAMQCSNLVTAGDCGNK
jgi:hypothetical protein